MVGAEDAISVLHTGSSNVVAERGASTVGARLLEAGMGAGVEKRRISWVLAVFTGTCLAAVKDELACGAG